MREEATTCLTTTADTADESSDSTVTDDTLTGSTNTEDVPEMILIPKGTFKVGCNLDVLPDPATFRKPT